MSTLTFQMQKERSVFGKGPGYFVNIAFVGQNILVS